MCGKQFLCGKCDKGFSTRTSLLYHLDRMHSGAQWYVYPSVSLLDDGRWVCPRSPCNKTFATSFNVRRHLHTVHSHKKELRIYSRGKLLFDGIINGDFSYGFLQKSDSDCLNFYMDHKKSPEDRDKLLDQKDISWCKKWIE